MAAEASPPAKAAAAPPGADPKTKAGKETMKSKAEKGLRVAQAKSMEQVKALPANTQRAAAQTKNAMVQSKAAVLQGKDATMKQLKRVPVPEKVKKKFAKKPRESVEVPDLTGKVAIVTGGNTGLGYETAKTLLLNGAHVIIVGRSEPRCLEAVNALKGLVAEVNAALDADDGSVTDVSESVAGEEDTEAQEDVEIRRPGEIEYMLCDLASLRSIEAFAEDFKSRALPLHMLVNNAGVYLPPDDTTAEGWELQIGVNHVGTFYLTRLLADHLKQSSPSRVVVVSSGFAGNGKYRGDELQREAGRKCDLSAYATSKLFNVMFANEMRVRLAPENVDVITVHPGLAVSDIQNKTDRRKPAAKLSALLSKKMAQPTDLGALSLIYAAAHPDAKGEFGAWYGPDAKNKNNTMLRYVANNMAQDPAWSRRLYDDTTAAIKAALAPPPQALPTAASAERDSPFVTEMARAPGAKQKAAPLAVEQAKEFEEEDGGELIPARRASGPETPLPAQPRPDFKQPLPTSGSFKSVAASPATRATPYETPASSVQPTPVPSTPASTLARTNSMKSVGSTETGGTGGSELSSHRINFGRKGSKKAAPAASSGPITPEKMR